MRSSILSESMEPNGVGQGFSYAHHGSHQVCVCLSLSLYIYISQIKQNLIYTWRENLILSYLNIVKYICPM